MERTAEVEALLIRVVADGEPAVRLQALSALRRELDSMETELAAHALRSGMSWREIGGAIGVTKQAAHRRHSQGVAELETDDGTQRAGSAVVVSVPARRAVRLARAEAARLGVDEVGTEHLLLGLLQCGDVAVADLLRDLGITLNVTRDALEPTVSTTLEAARRAYAQSQEDANSDGAAAAAVVSPVARRTLERALTRASARGSNQLTALDLLHAVLVHDDAGAARTLHALGVDPRTARAQVAEAQAISVSRRG